MIFYGLLSQPLLTFSYIPFLYSKVMFTHLETLIFRACYVLYTVQYIKQDTVCRAGLATYFLMLRQVTTRQRTVLKILPLRVKPKFYTQYLLLL